MSADHQGLFGLGALNIPTFLLAKGDEVITDDMSRARHAVAQALLGAFEHPMFR